MAKKAPDKIRKKALDDGTVEWQIDERYFTNELVRVEAPEYWQTAVEIAAEHEVPIIKIKRILEKIPDSANRSRLFYDPKSGNRIQYYPPEVVDAIVAGL